MQRVCRCWQEGVGSARRSRSAAGVRVVVAGTKERYASSGSRKVNKVARQQRGRRGDNVTINQLTINESNN